MYTRVPILVYICEHFPPPSHSPDCADTYDKAWVCQGARPRNYFCTYRARCDSFLPGGTDKPSFFSYTNAGLPFKEALEQSTETGNWQKLDSANRRSLLRWQSVVAVARGMKNRPAESSPMSLYLIASTWNMARPSQVRLNRRSFDIIQPVTRVIAIDRRFQAPKRLCSQSATMAICPFYGGVVTTPASRAGIIV